MYRRIRDLVDHAHQEYKALTEENQLLRKKLREIEDKYERMLGEVERGRESIREYGRGYQYKEAEKGHKDGGDKYNDKVYDKVYDKYNDKYNNKYNDKVYEKHFDKVFDKHIDKYTDKYNDTYRKPDQKKQRIPIHKLKIGYDWLTHGKLLVDISLMISVPIKNAIRVVPVSVRQAAVLCGGGLWIVGQRSGVRFDPVKGFSSTGSNSISSINIFSTINNTVSNSVNNMNSVIDCKVSNNHIFISTSSTLYVYNYQLELVNKHTIKNIIKMVNFSNKVVVITDTGNMYIIGNNVNMIDIDSVNNVLIINNNIIVLSNDVLYIVKESDTDDSNSTDSIKVIKIDSNVKRISKCYSLSNTYLHVHKEMSNYYIVRNSKLEKIELNECITDKELINGISMSIINEQVAFRRMDRKEDQILYTVGECIKHLEMRKGLVGMVGSKNVRVWMVSSVE